MSQRTPPGNSRVQGRATASNTDMNQMNDHPRGAHLFPPELVPAVLPGDYIEVLGDNSVRRITNIIQQPGVFTFDASQGNDVLVGANSTVSDNEVEAIEMPDTVAGQVRMVDPGNDIPSDVQVQIDLGGRASQMMTTNNEQGFIDHETGTQVGYDGTGTVADDDIDTHLTELYLFGPQDIYFTFTNTTAGDETVSDVRFSGYQYVTEPVTRDDVPDGVRPVPWPNEPVIPK